MHLKLLIGVLALGLAAANPKTAEKRAAKPSPQDYSSGQQFYVPGNDFGQYYAGQQFAGQPSSGQYNVQYVPANYAQSNGNPIGVPVYPQGQSGNYYQQPQLFPVPVGYSNVASLNGVQSNYQGAGRLWPKTLVNPSASPAPQVYYPSSTPSPVAYQPGANYAGFNPFVTNQVPGSTPAPYPTQSPQLIPVPVKVTSRNSFQPAANYNAGQAAQNIPLPVSSPAPYPINYSQQSTPASFVQQNYQQPTAIPYSAYQQPASRGPYQVNYQQQVAQAQYQQPSSSPYLVNYQQQATAAPYQVRYQQQPTQSPYQVGYQQQQPIQAGYQVGYQQQPTVAPYQVKYQQQAAPSLNVAYQQPTIDSRSSFAAYQSQPTAGPYVAQYQSPTGASYVPQYQSQPSGASYLNYRQSAASPFLAQYQRIPVPVGYPQNQILPQPTQPILAQSVTPTNSYSNIQVPVKSQSISVSPVTSPAPIQTVSITEKPFVPLPVSASNLKPNATILKSEYNVGTVSPQYNHIPLSYSTSAPVYSTASPLYATSTAGYTTPSPVISTANSFASNPYLPDLGKSSYGLSYAPAKSVGYSSPTSTSHVRFTGLGAQYSY